MSGSAECPPKVGEARLQLEKQECDPGKHFPVVGRGGKAAPGGCLTARGLRGKGDKPASVCRGWKINSSPGRAA